jgi:pilus assembly protein Flp/PilA
MLKFLILLQNFLAQPVRRDDRGATAVEYGLIVALIAGAVIVAVGLLGTAINGRFLFVLNNL